ncbi:MAG: ATP-binding protein [Thermoleophilia bacterium]
MEGYIFKRATFQKLLNHVREPRRFIQVLSGPRQSGKTTLARQVMEGFKGPSHYATADEPTFKDSTWLEQQWETARTAASSDGRRKALLVLDEIQKITDWSETVKRLWDEDTASGLPLQVMILGSAALLVQKGLSESLAGRYEVAHITHWSFTEMREAFGWNLDKYIFFGGYPGAASLITDHERWASYIREALIEPTISRDILLMTRVDKPALLHRLFYLGCVHSGQILSYQKMLGQLQDAGNTTTLAHYLDLLNGAGLITGLQKFAGGQVRRRASSPKLLALNTALMTAPADLTLTEARQNSEYWGHLVETAIGASLANGLKGKAADLYYWRKGNLEVDFVINRGDKTVAIEVKSSQKQVALPGITAFSDEFAVSRKLLVGANGIQIEDFLLTPPERWLE